MNEEIWKNIWHHPNYDVSNLGNVRSRISKSFRNLSPATTKSGYKQVSLNRKTYYVHRLVAEAFVGNPGNYPIINHKDKNRGNNNADNLEWCTVRYNNYYSENDIKFIEQNKKKVVRIDKDNKAKHFNSIKEAAEDIGVFQSVVSNAIIKHITLFGCIYIYEKDYDSNKVYDVKDRRNGDFSKPVEVITLLGNKTKQYPNLRTACKELGINIASVRNYISKNKPYNGKIFKYL